MRVGEPDSDLAALPDRVRAAAHVHHKGEVVWRNDHAEDAINALADNGKLIHGLDAWTLYPDGGVMEIPVSAWKEQAGETEDEAIERARREALDALPFAKSEGSHVLIGW